MQAKCGGCLPGKGIWRSNYYLCKKHLPFTLESDECAGS